jgi:hypothetical protein
VTLIALAPARQSFADKPTGSVINRHVRIGIPPSQIWDKPEKPFELDGEGTGRLFSIGFQIGGS